MRGKEGREIKDIAVGIEEVEFKGGEGGVLGMRGRGVVSCHEAWRMGRCGREGPRGGEG